jgi:hypothetical protein
MAQFVDHKAIERRDIKGTFEKFYYYCAVNGKIFQDSIYARSEDVILNLISLWNRLSTGTCSMYQYYYCGQHVSIRLEDIPADNNYKLKMVLSDSRAQVSEYIQ